MAEDFDELVSRLKLSHAPSLPAVNSAGAHSNPGALNKKLDDVAYRNLREWYARDYSFLDSINTTFDWKS